MGLFNRRKEKESALPGQIEPNPEAPPLAPAGSVAGTPTEDWHQMLMQNLSGAQVTVEPTQSFDFRNVDGLREDVMAAMKEHGIDPSNPGTVDASQVQGLQEAIGKAFQQHGIDLAAMQGAAMSAWSTMGAGAPAATPPQSTEQIADKLKRLDSLRAQGALSDDEYQTERKKVLDEL
jgi:Short C-terminal domain